MGKKIKTVADAVRYVIANTDKDTVFSGYDLKNKCVFLCTDLQHKYVETFLRTMREYCHFDYCLIDKKKSLYKKITPSIQEKKADEYRQYMQLKQQELFTEGV